MSNYPDDWGTYYHSCGCHAAWGCDCNENSPENSKRPWLQYTDYEFNYEDSMWEKQISLTRHVARKDHKDGTVKKGQGYSKETIRCICDNTGDSWHIHRKYIHRKGNFRSSLGEALRKRADYLKRLYKGADHE